MSEGNGKLRTFDLGTIEADPKKLSEGSWFEIWREPNGTLDARAVDRPTENGCVLIVERGIAYDRVRDEELRPYRDRINVGPPLTDDEVRRLNGRVLGRASFRGCHNLAMPGGEVIVWSEARAIELMTDDRWIRLRELVQRKQEDKAAAAKREEAQATGN